MRRRQHTVGPQFMIVAVIRRGPKQVGSPEGAWMQSWVDNAKPLWKLPLPRAAEVSLAMPLL